MTQVAPMTSADLIAKLQTAGYKVLKTNKKSAKKAEPEKSERVQKYEAAVMRGLIRKGIKKADIKLRVNVLPFKGWTEKGRVVRKGEHGVRGLFHVSQTEPLEA